MERVDYDVWYCDRCKWTWIVPAVPHLPECPQCSRRGWWVRFTIGEAYQVPEPKKES